MNASAVSDASARVEARDVGARDAERAEHLELVAQRRQARRRVAWREELARMRIERQHRRRQAQVLRGFDEAREHRLVAAMDTVEVADRQRDRRVGRPAGRPR